MAYPDYAAMKKELPKMKAALTKAKNQKDWKKVIAVCDKAFARFDEIGWPDQHFTWEIAKRDAELQIQYAKRDTYSRIGGQW